ncbi:MAG: sodium/pantothenate symporter [Verrucomicrobiales bacterium]|jgi:sodium/pantothenate symporter
MSDLSSLPAMLAASGDSSNSVLVTFVIYLIGVFALAAVANRVGQNKAFMNEYFLGGRNIGLWAFALTYAATAASGGSFMGFPGLIYTHGWSLGWWICGYMVTPLIALGLLAKRLNQVGRIAGAITVPELMLKRFNSKAVGATATLIVVFFMFFYLLAQFKGGAKIMSTLLDNNAGFQGLAAAVDRATDSWMWVGAADGGYIICLILFSIAVVVYTAYGGFRAVVWTDVMQGLVMAAGVIIMLFLALHQVGGLSKATEKIAQMTPPDLGKAEIELSEPAAAETTFQMGTWLLSANGDVVRLKSDVVFAKGERSSSKEIEVIILTTPFEIDEQRSNADPRGVANIQSKEPYAFGAGQKGVYLTSPGPSATNPQGFLPVILALSFFAFWNFAGAGQPSYMVRQMAFKDSAVLRRSMMFVGVFFTLIYLPLVIIFTCARVILPGWEIDPDRIMPEMAAALTSNAGMPWLAGLLIAAPFAAIMSSVDSFLLLVSSGVVRDIYQQHINPNASDKAVKRLSHMVTITLGVFCVIAVLNPPQFLQTLIVFASAGIAACFLMPMALALYWPRMTANGAVAGMLTGAITILGFYIAGTVIHGEFSEYNFLGLHPFIWSILVTTLAIVGVSRMDAEPDEKLVEKYFGR